MVAERTTRGFGGHSATVHMTLLVGGLQHRVLQAGGSRLLLEEAVLLPTYPVEMVLSIDGQVQRFAVTVEPAAQATSSYKAVFQLCSVQNNVGTKAIPTP